MTTLETLENELTENRNSLSTDRLDMSFGEIMSMYERNEIIIDPDFQRLFRWDDYQKTRFVESILIGIPIPQIFVAEDDHGRWELVDGLQRISTVFSFFSVLKTIPEKNNWTMVEGDLVKSLDGFKCSELPLKFQLNIKRASCRVEIIKWNSAFDMRYELFNRLNTGGSDLTDQEIRNAIFRGVSKEFNKFLRRGADSQNFIDLVKPTPRQVETLYLDELVLRYCALIEAEQEIANNISQHMTKYMKTAVQNTDEIPRLEDLFRRTINVLTPLNSRVFRGSNNVFSTSLYDCIMIGVGSNIDKYENMGKEAIQDKIKQLKGDEDFQKASGSASASKSRIVRRLEVSKKIF